MKWLFYLFAVAAIPMAVGSFALVASDIQIIIGIQFVVLAVLSWGIGLLLSRVS